MTGQETTPSGLPGTAPLSMAAAEAVAATAPTPDDEPWATIFGAINIADHPTVLAVRGDEVFAAGDFVTHMAGMYDGTYLRIAHWDGSGWRRMGDGVDAAVHALAVVGDDVYVGGYLTMAGGTVAVNRLARWDGTTWWPVAGGVSSSQFGTDAYVRALASDGTTLYVAGTFDAVGAGDGAIAANGFAALDLATGTWRTCEGGLWWQDGPGEGRALLVTADRVYVGGAFDRAGGLETASLAAVDPGLTRWETFGAGVRSDDYTGIVDSLALDQTTGTVFVGGKFTTAGTVSTSCLATLTAGDFGTLGSFTQYDEPRSARVVALAHSGGRLYAAGLFTAVDGVPADHWAAHDGAGWSVPSPVDNAVVALAPYGDGVVATGMFTQGGGLRMPHGGIWTGATWQTFGQGLTFDPYADGYVYALVATESGVYAGGYFDQVGPVAAAAVAEWRDGAWHDMGGGVGSSSSLATVRAMLRVGSDLYVTGVFDTAGGVEAAGIARWDGHEWHALGSGLGGTGSALVMLGGRLYVGGSFYQAGGLPAYNVASWDPATETWSAVGSAPVYDRAVLSLAAVEDRYLIVGGEFSKLWMGRFQVGGLNALVIFDTHWPPDPADPFVGYFRIPGVTSSWMPGAVRAMQLVGTDLYVGGTFDRAGVQVAGNAPSEGFPATGLAVCHLGTEDDRWSTPGEVQGSVTAFATLEGRSLAIGGWFSGAGPTAASSVVELDPASGEWTTYGSGIGWGLRGGPLVQALAQRPEDGLWVGGSFTVAGGAPSCSIALWQGTAGRAP